MSIYEIVRSLVEEKRAKNSKYNKFKKAVLAYYGVNSPEELDPKRKKQFYKYIDSQWKRFKTSMQTQGEEQ